MSHAAARISKRTIVIFTIAVWLLALSLLAFIYAISHAPLISFSPTQEQLTFASRMHLLLVSLFSPGVALIAVTVLSLVVDNAKSARRR